jgi:hypothetical protein
MTIPYTGVIEGGVWHEIGERLMPGQEPIRVLEMKLKRIGDPNWPADHRSVWGE